MDHVFICFFINHISAQLNFTFNTSLIFIYKKLFQLLLIINYINKLYFINYINLLFIINLSNIIYNVLFYIYISAHIVFHFLYAKHNFLHLLIWVHMHCLFFLYLSNTISNIIIVITFKSIFDYTQSLIHRKEQFSPNKSTVLCSNMCECMWWGGKDMLFLWLLKRLSMLDIKCI